MTQPLLPLLVLAWDDADASPHLPGAPRPAPTLPALRALAAHQPLLAVLPQLPAAVRDEAQLDALATEAARQHAAALAAGQAAKQAAAPLPAEAPVPAASSQPGLPGEKEPAAQPPAAPPVAPAPAVPAPGIVPLVPDSPNQAFSTTAPTPASRIMGLVDVGFTTVARKPAATPAAEPAPGVFSPFVWPAVPRRAAVQLPAAPYLGSAAGPEPAAPEPAAGPPAPAWREPGGVLQAPQHVYDLAFDPDPELPLLPGHAPAAYSGEPGAEEAAALDAPAEDLTLSPTDAGLANADADDDPGPEPAAAPARPAAVLPAAPERATITEGLAALRRPADDSPAPAAADAPAPPPARVPAPAALSDDLHYRIIQYARFATHAATDPGEQFGVVFAPDWPTWLAALEIRYRLRRPLVLHLTALALHETGPADRGWRLEIERYALRRAHTVLAATPELREQVLAHYGLAPDRVLVLALDDADGLAAVLARLSTAAPA